MGQEAEKKRSDDQEWMLSQSGGRKVKEFQI